MPEKQKARAHVFVEGMVQGVFFRANTHEVAASLGLAGWVRNCRDGRVEAIFEGNKEDIEEAVKWCHKGPPGAVVKKVDLAWEEPKGEFKNFSIKYW